MRAFNYLTSKRKTYKLKNLLSSTDARQFHALRIRNHCDASANYNDTLFSVLFKYIKAFIKRTSAAALTLEIKMENEEVLFICEDAAQQVITSRRVCLSVCVCVTKLIF